MEDSQTAGRAKARTLPNRTPLVDDVYDVILEVLVSNEVQPGQPFNIEAFARELGVSPTPVREALTRAEGEGLVLKVPARGFIASPLLTSDQLRQMTDMRLLLEPWAAARAAEAADKRSVEQLRSIARIGSGGDRDLAYRDDMQRDTRFHEAVWGLAGNNFIRDSLSRMHFHLHLYRLLYTEELRHVSQAEHLRIADAIAAGDASAAHDAMLDHISVAVGRVHHRTGQAEGD